MKKTYKMAPAEVGEVTLTMTFREALALRILAGHLGGAGPIRAAMNKVHSTLCEVPGLGVFGPDNPFEGGTPTMKEDFEL